MAAFQSALPVLRHNTSFIPPTSQLSTKPTSIPSAPAPTPTRSHPILTISPPQPPKQATKVLHYYRTTPVNPRTLRVANNTITTPVTITEEICYNVLTTSLTDDEQSRLEWLLRETFAPALTTHSTLPQAGTILEVGPRKNFQTAWSSNAVSIAHACRVMGVIRLERSRRYCILPVQGTVLDDRQVKTFLDGAHDSMTETVYPEPMSSFDVGVERAQSYEIDVLTGHEEALREASDRNGFGFDEQDIKYYDSVFSSMGRNPTNVELFDLAQSNSEHSRHWFFRGRLVIDGKEAAHHLFDIVRETLKRNPGNSVVAFADNSSTIRGGVVDVLQPEYPGGTSKMIVKECDRDVLCTAETHNFPSGVAPFPGAETGTGGRIRDTAATGIGSLVLAGTCGYAVGNLRLPGCEHLWEEDSFLYPSNLASPLEILIQASNGASDYGNKFGEPVINGFARSYGMRLEDGQRREYVKPIMFSGGIGQMEHSHSEKGIAEEGMLVVKVGGPAYRIGMGGGAASSMMQGDNASERDFDAVQRGDAEMAQKVYRVLRACVEMGMENPIVAIHDQGAGGNCNVVKELIYPSGGKIDIRKVWVGDDTLSAVEIWGAEYQEQFGLLLRPKDEAMFRDLCARENVVPAVLGVTDGSGRIVLWDEEEKKAVVDMDLEQVLGDLPQKTFTDSRIPYSGEALRLPSNVTVKDALTRVLSLMTVGSKRFLTTKVDRSVTGLVAQQQCVGPLQLPLSDYAVTAQSHFSVRGMATAIGERPSLTSLSPYAMGRMTVGEMMTNIAGAKLTAREHIKCEGNWMWAAKLPGDGASIYDAAMAMKEVMVGLSIAVDGGKDSLSMAAACPTETGRTETVRAPGTLVVTGYCTVADVQVKVTPDIKLPGQSSLLLVDIADGKRRLGGSCLGQVYKQVGDNPPDVDDVSKLRAAFDTVQSLISQGLVLSYHDISDGGLLVSLLEMGFAGNCGLDVSISGGKSHTDVFSSLFAEELGMILEVSIANSNQVNEAFNAAGVECFELGKTRRDSAVHVQWEKNTVLSSDIRDLRDDWERTSFALERLQANEECVEQEQGGLQQRTGPTFKVPWQTLSTPTNVLQLPMKPKVAVLREEGSNGDREMCAAFHMAGFEVWDVSMRDLLSNRVDLSSFVGAAFVGGFSYADVLDSAKGWAGAMRYNEELRSQFDDFYGRLDTFSLGVCNGCQLMALLGRVPFASDLDDQSQPRFIHNQSGRYESRFSTVRIEQSPSIMLNGMEGGQLGVWVAHGEGRAYFPDENILTAIEEQNLVPVRYIDDNSEVARSYPANPNGSTNGIAGLCSRDGRHLALMPHPERTVLKWQWGYLPSSLSSQETSPWLTMFQNAYTWVTRNR